MSKIDELIQRLCPKGVEHKSLGSLIQVFRGKRLTKKELSDEEKHPVYHGGLEPLGYYSQSNREGNTVMVINVGASAGTVGYSNVDFWSSDGCFALGSSEQLISRYLYYALICQEKNLRSNVRVAGIPTLDASAVQRVVIPVPPIEIQEEIVGILDKYILLEAELEAELEARKTQYEHYRDTLLSFESKNVEWKELGEIGSFTRGKRFVKTDILSKGFPCIHYGEMYTHYKISAKESKSFLDPSQAARLRVAKHGDVIIVAAGETIEDIGQGVAWLGESDVVIHDACFAYSHKMHPNYVSHFLQTDIFHSQIKRYISSGKISSINASGLSKARIPVPPIEEQIRIATILDKFHILINDIAVGLPAEIQARRKQYEYYRNKLLTFKPLNQNDQEI